MTFVSRIDNDTNNEYYTYAKIGHQPVVKPYSGWASYRNNKSGNFNRSLCGNCLHARGYPQAAGTYPLNIDDTPWRKIELERVYQPIDQERIDINTGNIGGYYVNYLNEQCKLVYPRRYVKGFWPDEQKIYTNAPKNDCYNTEPNALIPASLNESKYW